jgi:hypothetical protein
MDICCTLVNGNYFKGAASLVNSLVSSGFQGEIHVGYDGVLPTWWPQDSSEVAPNVVVVNVLVQTDRFFGYEKPFFMLAVARSRPQCERICWFDADIVALGPWKFVQDWIDAGIAICADVAFPQISPLHPWRTGWRALIQKANLKEHNLDLHTYPNGGFLGCRTDNISIVHIWIALTQAFEAAGGDVTKYYMQQRWKAIVSDQDLLATALMCSETPLVSFGAEGMGFNGLALPLCHGVESPKPWQMGALGRAISGAGISLYRRQFEDFVRSGPIKPFNRNELLRRNIELKLAILIARFYKR